MYFKRIVKNLIFIKIKVAFIQSILNLEKQHIHHNNNTKNTGLFEYSVKKIGVAINIKQNILLSMS